MDRHRLGVSTRQIQAIFTLDRDEMAAPLINDGSIRSDPQGGAAVRAASERLDDRIGGSVLALLTEKRTSPLSFPMRLSAVRCKIPKSDSRYSTALTQSRNAQEEEIDQRGLSKPVYHFRITAAFNSFMARSNKLFSLCGEPAGTRTQDPRLKRALLYQLSYGLSPAATRQVAAINSCADSSLP